MFIVILIYIIITLLMYFIEFEQQREFNNHLCTNNKFKCFS